MALELSGQYIIFFDLIIQSFAGNSEVFSGFCSTEIVQKQRLNNTVSLGNCHGSHCPRAGAKMPDQFGVAERRIFLFNKPFDSLLEFLQVSRPIMANKNTDYGWW
jgi:hypothetical protein